MLYFPKKKSNLENTKRNTMQGKVSGAEGTSLGSRAGWEAGQQDLDTGLPFGVL